jgi:hypothetical protein
MGRGQGNEHQNPQRRERISYLARDPLCDLSEAECKEWSLQLGLGQPQPGKHERQGVSLTVSVVSEDGECAVQEVNLYEGEGSKWLSELILDSDPAIDAQVGLALDVFTQCLMTAGYGRDEAALIRGRVASADGLHVPSGYIGDWATQSDDERHRTLCAVMEVTDPFSPSLSD